MGPFSPIIFFLLFAFSLADAITFEIYIYIVLSMICENEIYKGKFED